MFGDLARRDVLAAVRWVRAQHPDESHKVVGLGLNTGAAARSLLGRAVTIAKVRGQTLRLADSTAAFVTIHPSWLLRMENEADKEREYKNFVADLRPAAKVLSSSHKSRSAA